jgi:acyl-coenzyme A synthetase/AMP-(fatty) acid ligase
VTLRLAVATPRLNVTYGRLARASVAIADRLTTAGLKTGQTAGVAVLNPALHIAIVVALNKLGIVTVSLGRDPNSGLEALSGIRLDWMVSDGELAPPAGTRVVTTGWAWLDDVSTAPLAVSAETIRDDAPILLATSSGTTGAPKVIRYTARQIEDRLLSYGYRTFAPRTGESAFCLFGLRTMVGFQIALTTLVSGGTLFMGFLDQDVGKIIQQFRVDRLFGSPNQLAQVLQALEREPADCSSLKLVFVGGSATPPSLAARLAQRLCTNLVSGYGASEAGLIAHAPLGRLLSTPGAVGYLEPWCLAEAVDEQEKPLPQGSIGRLRFKNGQAVSAYEGARETPQSAFRDGWFYPGDVGAVTAERLLILAGRDDEVLNIGGVKLDPMRVAEVLLSHSAIEDAAVFTAPNAKGENDLWAALVVKGRPDVDALRRFFRERLGPRAPSQLLFPPRLPRNENGKLVIAELRTMTARALARLGTGERREP